MDAAPLVANARMYAVTPVARDLWRRLFEWTSDKARIQVAYVDHAAPASLEELWSRDDLGLAFMCGYPFAMARPWPQLVAAPVPADPRCAGQALYWTDLVVAADGPHRSLSDTFGGRIGWTIEHSQSGFNAVRHHLLRYRSGRKEPLFRESVGPLVTPRRVVESVLSGRIDVGPLDSYFHELLRRFEPETAARLRTVESTAARPMPVLVASPGTMPAAVGRLRRALLTASADGAMAAVLAELALAGFTAPEPAAYAVLVKEAAKAEAAGYRVPA
jgi:ABC-type phosphate/phosphonate transport system substrate-binding protein